MGRAPCCQKVGLRRGRWTAEEDGILIKYIQDNGEGSWRSLPKNAGLLRCGKSCRLRWINYLRTDLKRGSITPQEEDLIIKLHATIGNRWSLIASQLPGRTDNEIKNHWNSHLSRSINTWRRPVNDTLPQHIIDNLAKLMAKPNSSTIKEVKKSAPIVVNHTGDNKAISHEGHDYNNEKPLTPDAFKESLPSNSWSTDQSLESIFSLEAQQDTVEVVEDYGGGGTLSLNEIDTILDPFIVPQPDHAFDGVMDLDFMNDLTNLGNSHAEMISGWLSTCSPIAKMDDTRLKPSLSSTYDFEDVMNISEWNCWEDYGETPDEDLINDEVGSFVSWLWECDGVGVPGCT